MTGDRQVIQALREQRYDARTLDPQVVIAGARRRRRRNRLASGIASVGVAGVAVTAVAVAGGIGGPGTVPEPQAAGSGGPSAAASTVPASTRPASTRPAPGWVPGGTVGARPIGTVPRSGKVEIAAQYWFETKGTRWCISQRDGKYLNQPFGCRGTEGNANIGDGRLAGMQRSTDAAGRIVVSSVFRGDLRRVLFTSGRTYYEAKLYRLAGVPGWMLAVATYPARESGEREVSPPESAVTVSPIPRAWNAVFGYDANGRLVARFPAAADGGPASHPLQGR